MSERGRIRNSEAYARGKMLDHSGWQKGDNKLPRNITPSDIDMVFDNSGDVLFCEVSSSRVEWKDLDIGQRKTYQNSIRGTDNFAVLCTHAVPLDAGRQINSRQDIQQFQVMVFDPKHRNPFVTTEVFVGNDRWQKFVSVWFNNPSEIRRHCRKNAEQIANHESGNANGKMPEGYDRSGTSEDAVLRGATTLQGQSVR